MPTGLSSAMQQFVDSIQNFAISPPHPNPQCLYAYTLTIIRVTVSPGLPLSSLVSVRNAGEERSASDRFWEPSLFGTKPETSSTSVLESVKISNGKIGILNTSPKMIF